jgi:MFS family permease
VLWATLSGFFAVTFPITILTVSLKTIAVEFDTDVTVLSWVITAPMLGAALCTPILGKAGDVFGHRRVFLLGFALATLLAALTTLATSAAMLIALRTAAQVVGAATGPTSVALIASVYAPAERVRAMGWWTFIGAGAPTLGLVLGGPMVDAVGWQSVFGAQAVLAALALAFATFVLDESTERTRVPLDLAGAATLALGAGSLMLLLSMADTWGLTHPALLACAVLAPVALWGFLRIERRVAHPLLQLGWFRQRNVTAPIITETFQSGSYFGGFVLAPLVLQDVFAYSARETAWILVVRTFAFTLASPAGGRLGAQLGERTMATFGATLVTAAMAIIAAGVAVESLAVALTGLVLQGAGYGLGRPSISSTVANAVPLGDVGIVTATLRMLQQLGNAFGITVMTVLYAGTTDALAQAYVAGAALALVGTVAASFIVSLDRDAHHDAADAAATTTPSMASSSVT